MGRNRISWDMEKAASMEKQADPYTMNQTRKNPPVEKYENWDTEKGGEAVDTKTPWKGEGRNEVGLPAPAKGSREAVVSARQMEDKALKCITIAQRMLPGASDQVIEAEATDLMYLPEHCVLATLQRQSALAEVLASSCKDEEEEADAEAKKKADPAMPAEGEGDEADAEAKKKADPAMPAEGEEGGEADAEAKKKTAAKPVKPEGEEGDEADAEAKKKAPKEKSEYPEEDKKPAPVIEEASKKAEEKPEEKPAEKKPAEPEAPAAAPQEVEAASDADLLDQIFAQDDAKAGVKKLSGIVKQASMDNSLDNLWDAPPDVSKVFGR